MQPQNCNGDGRCLGQANDKDYYKLFNCNHNCQLIECPNYKMCNTKRPECILDSHGGRCLHCNMLFGKNLEFIQEKDECDVCSEEKLEFVKMPNCTHKLCPECFYSNNYPHVPHREENKILEQPTIDVEVNDNEEETVETEPPKYAGKCPICRINIHIDRSK